MAKHWLAVMILALTIRTGISQTPPTVANSNSQTPPASISFSTEINPGVTPPELKTGVAADTPSEVFGRNIAGACLVSLVVDTTGMPTDVHTFRCTNPVFSESSADAVLRSRFKPAHTQDGQPIALKVGFIEAFHVESTDIDYCHGGPDHKSLLGLSLRTPPTPHLNGPDLQGVFDYSKDMNPPTLTLFDDSGFCKSAFEFQGELKCSVLMTINNKGSVQDVGLPDCSDGISTKSLAASLRKTKFKRATKLGQPISIRVTLQVSFGKEQSAS